MARSGEKRRLVVCAPDRLASFLCHYNSHLDPVLEDLQQVKNEHLLLTKPKGGKVSEGHVDGLGGWT